MRDSFVFYLSQYDAIKELTDEQIGRLMRAIFEKQLGKEVVLENDIKIAFNFINNQMLVDQKKYAETCEKRRLSGKQGGAPKGNQNARKTTKNKQNKLNDNENDNENDIKKESKKEKPNYEEVLKKFSLSEEVENAVRDFIQMRSFIKHPLTNRGLELAIKEVLRLSSQEEEQVKIFEQSVMRNWLGVFPLKEQQTKSKEQAEIDAFMEKTAREWGME